MKKLKKGITLNEAAPAVLTLVAIATLVIISIYLFGSLGSSMSLKNTAGTAVNESVTPVTVGVNLAGASLTDGVCGSITKVYDGETEVEITVGNYTQTGCVIANKTSEFPNAWKINYPYTYSKATAATNASNVTMTTFSTYPALVGLVGTIIFLALVIGVLVISFAFRRNGP